MINVEFIKHIYSAASITRWNDHIRPVDFTELDKQAHKIIILYVIAKMEETRGQWEKVKWLELIEGAVFEFFYRVVLTDIKAPVFHKLVKEKRAEVNRFVFKNLEPSFRGGEKSFFERFKLYHNGDRDLFTDDSRRMIRAAHYLSSQWEFNIIYNTASYIYGIENIKQEIENEIEDHSDLLGVQKISLRKKSYGFIDLCGQLRFQKRWAHTIRIPETSVLGHMLVVALLSFMISINIRACSSRIYNNFFGGMFHDLPEILTRDIISPVKRGVEGLNELIAAEEVRLMEERLLPLLPREWHDELRYFTQDEFSNKIHLDGRPEMGISELEMNSKYNEDDFLALDGKIIWACDQLAAYIEAKTSIDHGIRSDELGKAMDNIASELSSLQVNGVDFMEIFKAVEEASFC